MAVLPSKYKLLYSSKQIADRVQDLSSLITPWCEQVWDTTGQDVVAVPILRGGIFFFADLLTAVDYSVEVAPTKTIAYVENVNQSQHESVKLDISTIPTKNRTILLVDDICDSGKTMRALTDALLKDGAQEVRSAVLVRRQIEKSIFEPNWIGFEYPGPEWLIGYGMEDGRRWRNLPEVYIIEGTGQQ